MSAPGRPEGDFRRVPQDGTPVSALRLSQIRVGYGGSAPAIDDVSLTLDGGQIACLLGPSGCGKTTVLRAIAGFEPLLAGTISLGDMTLASHHLHLPPERRCVGLMFQEFALFPHLDVTGNIGFGLRRATHAARSSRVKELLALVEMSGCEGRYPHELSGGQQQRVALARALAPSPRLLLLDEPFSSLDTSTRERLVADVRSILKAAGQTAVMVTHDEQEAASVADWIGTMHKGKLSAWRPVPRDGNQAPGQPR